MSEADFRLTQWYYFMMESKSIPACTHRPMDVRVLCSIDMPKYDLR